MSDKILGTFVYGWFFFSCLEVFVWRVFFFEVFEWNKKHVFLGCFGVVVCLCFFFFYPGFSGGVYRVLIVLCF